MPETFPDQLRGAIGLPHARFDSADYPPGEGLARWASLRPGYDVATGDTAAPEPFDLNSDAWMLGDLVVSSGRLSPVNLTRTEERISLDGQDHYLFALITRGRWSGTFGPQRTDILRGQVCLIDFAEPWSAKASATEFVMAKVSRSSVGALLPGAADLHGRVLEGMPGRLAAEHLTALVQHLPYAMATDAVLLESTTIRLLTSCLEHLPPRQTRIRAKGVGMVRRRAIRFIEDRLSMRDLGSAFICRELGLSRPALYRAMRSVGGVSTYIQHRRLDTIHALLYDRTETRDIAEIAEAFGFSSHSHFSTAFRRRFGYPPGDVRSRSGSPAQGGPVTRIDNWLRQLRQGEQPATDGNAEQRADAQ